MKFAVVGHSWGAYACQNISAFHHDLTHIVAMSGFVSVEAIVTQNFSGILKPFRKMILALEQNANPDYVHCHAADSLKQTDAKILILHSADDPLVKQMYHFDIMRIVLEDKENIRFLLVNGKKHNPNYTLDAVKYKDSFFEIHSQKKKKHELETEDEQNTFRKSFDWKRMTAQDKFIWKEIFDTLDS
jgi:pimeloyl-ACP methyl ester carboxylesterase